MVDTEASPHCSCDCADPAPSVEDDVRALFGDVVDTCSVATGMPLSLESMGLIESARDVGETAAVHMRLSSPMCYMLGHFPHAITSRVAQLPGIREAAVSLDNGLNRDDSTIHQGAAGARRAVFLALESVIPSERTSPTESTGSPEHRLTAVRT